MNRFSLSLLFIPFFSFLQAQEIIEVQAFNYNSETRDSVISFPEGDHNEYEKIVMLYSMRCKDGLVSPPVQGQTNLGCGEWDYSCNTFITDSTLVDSLKRVAPSHIISGFSGDVFPFSNDPTSTYIRRTQRETEYLNTISESEISAGADLSDLAFPFGGNSKISRSQVLYYASNLNGLGLEPGFITGLKLKIGENGGQYSNLKIRIKHTNKTELDPSTIDREGFAEVYFLDTELQGGEHFFKFFSPFNWNGSSNLILDFSYVKNDEMSTATRGVEGVLTTALHADATDDLYLEMNGSGLIRYDEPLEQISSEVTFSMWALGSNSLPVNTSIFEGKDVDGRRTVNVHLPWSNGRVYWDCGNEGGNYDRIERAASVNDYKNQWNHWAFTKNANTGEMKIYLNGELWQSGTGKNRLIDLQSLTIGANINDGNAYLGNIDEFRVWNKELSGETIKEWMNKSITPDHPNYDNLVSYYPLDEIGDVSVFDQSPNQHNAIYDGIPVYRTYEAKDLVKNVSGSSEQLFATFVQGEYETEVTEIIITDSIPNPQYKVDFYVVDGTDLVLDNTQNLYPAGDLPVYDEFGNLVDNVYVMEDGTINITQLTHYSKGPAHFEIMSFVTPYGINLDLGPEGKTWTFDVTDFGPILKGDKRIFMTFGGQWQEDMDIKFLFVKGTPTRDVNYIKQIWPVTSQGYQTLLANDRFEPRQIEMTDADKAMKIRAAITGHGQQGEFIQRTHWINVDGGTNELSWQVWTECSENPIYPQGGTWVYDRAGWCPGAATDVQELDVSEFINPGSSMEVDYGLITASGDSRYIVNMQMVSYGEPNFTNDARVTDILYPSKKIEHGRFNPICGNPQIEIQNSGANTLTELQIDYGIVNGEMLSYTWTGNLEFMEKELVTLPHLLPATLPNANEDFIVEVKNPNGMADEYAQNNIMTSEVDIIDIHTEDVIIDFVTNNAWFETSYQVLDINGNEIFSKPTTGLSANTLYRDTLKNLNGCFKLIVRDSGGDGLAWWANNDGTGSFTVRSQAGAFTVFNPDFGGIVNYDFLAGNPNSLEELEYRKFINVYPNPVSDQLNIRLEGLSGDLNVKIVDQMGSVLRTDVFRDVNTLGYNHDLDMSQLPNGVYFLQIQEGNQVYSRKVVKVQ